MPPSLVRFAGRNRSADGRSLFWDRADRDGLPFRGNHAPSFREEEFEDRTIRVADVRNAFFDTTDPTQNKQFLDVMECIFNGWFFQVHLERFWVGPNGQRTTKHYLEWVEYYLEDGSRTPYLSPGIMELAHGQSAGSSVAG